MTTIDVEFMKTILNEMVAIDTQSCTTNNEEMTTYMKSLLEKELGYTVVLIPYPTNPNKHNVLAYKKEGFKILFSGHLDTVDIGEGWTKKPLECTYEVIQERTHIFGRGTTDMKSGNAVAITLIREMIKHNKPVDDFALLFSTEEEIGIKGVKELMKTHKELFASVETYFVLEPTNLFVGNGENGHYWVKYTCTGKSAHGSNPFAGINAIEGLTDLNYILKEGIQSVELAGNVSLNIGKIEGGSAVNIVPDKCVEWVDYRFSPNVFYKDMEEMFEKIIYQMNEISMVQYSYEIISFVNCFRCRPKNQYLIKLNEYMKKIDRHTEVPMPYTTDGAVFKEAYPQSDVIIFGPGAVHSMHGKDEYVILEDMIICVEALLSLF